VLTLRDNVLLSSTQAIKLFRANTTMHSSVYFASMLSDLKSFLFFFAITDNHMVLFDCIILNLSMEINFTGNYYVTLVIGNFCMILFLSSDHT
jgi:hypothetical protein